MTQLRVWAPKVGHLAVEIHGERRPLERRPRGYWEAELADLRDGVDYALYADDEGPYPDPRTPFQPGGVLGPSRHVDHGRFAWSDAGFRAPPLAAAVIYELHVGTFTEEGTFAAAASKLQHLVELGVTHVELMPVNEFPGRRGWGYDGVDLFAPHHVYGGPEGLKRLVDACHRTGLAVILDVVYNHLGPFGNFLGVFGDYFNDAYKTPWGPAVNLDGPGSTEVRRFFCDNALHWLRDYHVDALRLDAVHAFIDRSATPFLEQLAREVRALERELGRPLTLIAESDLNDPRVVRPLEAGGLGLDAQWSDDFHHALHALLTGERDGYYEDFGSLAALATALEQVFVYDGRYSEHRRRIHGRSAAGTPPHRFLGYLQNHDQIGNRALGERSSALMSDGRLKLAAALVLLGPFVPMLFQGEEWGARTPFQYFTDHEDAGLAAAVRQGRRAEFAAFGWDPERIPDPQAEATFTRSRLRWPELDGESGRELYDWHRQLIRLRRETMGGERRARVAYDERAGWLALRVGRLLVLGNVGRHPAAVPLAGLVGGPHRLALRSPREVAESEGVVTLPADGVAVFTRLG